MPEWIDLLDESLRPIRVATKDEAHRLGLWHFAFHCWIVRPGPPASLIVQRRSRAKDLFPGLIDITAAGHYRSGEQPLDGLRELTEELGVEVAPERLVPAGIKVDVARVGAFVDREPARVFLLVDARPPEGYRPAADEVDALLEIGIADGTRMFSGASGRCTARGIAWHGAAWRSIECDVAAADFAPRVDAYHLKVLRLAAQPLAGDLPLAI